MAQGVTELLSLILMLDVSGESARVRASMSSGLEAQARSIAQQTGVMQKAVARPLTVARLQDACDPLPPAAMESLIRNAAQLHGVQPALVREVARQESGFRPCAVSTKGARGVMQLMPRTQAAFGVINPFDPAQSIDTGARLLKQLLDRYHGNVRLALGAYNAGTVAVDKSRGVPRIKETQAYVKRILGRLAPLDRD